MLKDYEEKIFYSTELEKEKFAEFGTPHQIRQTMISVIPKSIININMKILEPSCGKGAFLLNIIRLLMYNLPIKNSKERYKNIVENIIYFADINKKNILFCKKLLDPSGSYKLNYYVGDTLSDKFSYVNYFDLVIGNPPYNKLGSVGSGNTIYQDFIKKALEKWLKEGGYLDFVTPSAWRKPVTLRSKNYGMYNLMTKENNLKYLEIHGLEDGLKHFNASTRYDIYLIKKENPEGKTIIVDEKGKYWRIDVGEYPWLPNYDFSFIKKLLAKKNEKKLDVFSDLNYSAKKKHMSPTKSKKFKFICIHTTGKKGVRYYYSDTDKLGHFGVKKVIFGNSGVGSALVNDVGKYCVTEHGIAIVDDEKNLGKILEVLKGERMRDVFGACLWSPFQIDWRMFLDFKKDFWKYFNLEKKQ